MLRITNFLDQRFMIGFQLQLNDFRQRLIVVIAIELLSATLQKAAKGGICCDTEGGFYLGFCNVHGISKPWFTSLVNDE